jgi:hypothetical protein
MAKAGSVRYRTMANTRHFAAGYFLEPNEESHQTNTVHDKWRVDLSAATGCGLNYRRGRKSLGAKALGSEVVASNRNRRKSVRRVAQTLRSMTEPSRRKTSCWTTQRRRFACPGRGTREFLALPRVTQLNPLAG